MCQLAHTYLAKFPGQGHFVTRGASPDDTNIAEKIVPPMRFILNVAVIICMIEAVKILVRAHIWILHLFVIIASSLFILNIESVGVVWV